jgi:hypothetical protein
MPSESVPMIPAAPATTVPEALQFTLAGRVDAWDPHHRELTIGGRVLWVPTTLRVIDPQLGARIVVSGHVEERAARRIVTHLTFE